MMNQKPHKHLASRILKRQKGATLFFAMIGLVVLLLAAAALLRSVDTTTLIAGNISYRTSATSSGDAGVNGSIIYLAQQICGVQLNQANAAAGALNCPNGNVAAVNNDDAINGYYSSINPNDRIPAMLVAGAGRVVGLDGSGNTVSYVIERMCTVANTAATPQNCVYTELGDAPCNGTNEECAEKSTSALTFRVTARIDGPKGAQSYIQGFVY